MALRSLWLFICVLSFSFAAGLQAEAAVKGDGPAAKVNGVSITVRDVEKAIDEIIPTAVFHGSVTEEKRAGFRARAIQDLIRKELYYQAAVKQGMKVTEEESADALKKVEGRFRSEKEFEKALKSAGYTRETFQKELGHNILVGRFIETELTDKAKVTEEYLKDYYEKNKSTFKRPEAFRLKHILISVPPTSSAEEREKLKKRAEDVLARARAGEDFGDLAYHNSMDDWRIKNGDLGVVHKGRLDPAIEESLSKLEPGQISGLIETIYGYHIVKLEERTAAREMSFDEVKAKLKGQIEAGRKKELEEQLMKRLKEDAKIEIY